MIELFQHKKPDNVMTVLCGKDDEFNINMNKDIILKDREKLVEMLKKPKNKCDKQNIESLIMYLDKLLKLIGDDNTLELCWHKKDNIPLTYPIQLIKEDAYGVNACNYIEVSKGEKIITIDLKELADIISYDFMFRDLGDSHESIEKLLKNTAIISFEDSKILMDYFKSTGDNMYELSKTMKIGDTPYYSFETHKIHDYFHSRDMNTKRYRDVVDYSCKYANTIIANTIIKNSIHKCISCMVLSITPTSIVLTTNTDNEVDINSNLLEDISIRAFGRRFIINTKIEVF